MKVLNEWMLNIRRKSISEFTASNEKLFDKHIENVEWVGEINMKELAEKMMQANSVKGKLLFVALSGSHAHKFGKLISCLHVNIFKATDDKSLKDYVGFYASPMDEMLSLIPPPGNT